jgi:hypothetical protein
MAGWILNTAHTVLIVWPTVSSPSFVAASDFSLYLKEKKHSVKGRFSELWSKEEQKQALVRHKIGGHAR